MAHEDYDEFDYPMPDNAPDPADFKGKHTEIGGMKDDRSENPENWVASKSCACGFTAQGWGERCGFDASEEMERHIAQCSKPTVVDWISGVVNRVLDKREIRGCEARGDADSVYMTRYSLPRLGPFRVVLHVFHRSDADDLHDHPWSFLSLILWRGYVEVVGNPPSHGLIVRGAGDCNLCSECLHSTPLGVEPLRHRKDCRLVARTRTRMWPGQLLFRRATHKHRVELIDGKKAVTLVVMGPRWRDWGFFTQNGWRQWRRYFAEKGCKDSVSP